MKKFKKQYFWTILRICMGWIFLWAFLDKTFGLGFSTASNKAWLSGNSPTTGFLMNSTRGPLAEFFQSLAGSATVDWLFMLGLFFVGITLTLGFMVRLGSSIGALMLFLMHIAIIPPEHNPVLDDHVIYGIILIGLAITNNDKCCDSREIWAESKIVKKYPILK